MDERDKRANRAAEKSHGKAHISRKDGRTDKHIHV